MVSHEEISEKAIYILNPRFQAISFAPRNKCNLIVKLSAELYHSTCTDFDIKIKFNSSKGENNTLICMYRSSFRRNQVKLMLHTVLSFLTRPASQSRQLNPNGSMFAWHFTTAECTGKKLFPKRRIWMIDIFAPPYVFANRQKEQPNT